MINIKTYESFNENEWKMPTKELRDKMELAIYSYRLNSENFPEMENIKNILQDVSDFCYLNNLVKPVYDKELYSINDNGNLRAITAYKIYSVNEILSKNFYKTYIVFTFFLKNMKENIKQQMKDKIETMYKRLTNYGYTIKTIGDVRENYTSLYIIDKTDPITLKEILEAK